MSSGSWFDKPAIVRAGIDATASATSLGFTAAKLSTKLGFSVTRGLTTTGARLAGAAVDHALFSGRLGAGARLAAGLDAALTLAERAALAPLDLGETFVSSSLVATRAALDILYPGSEQPSAALPAFAALVRRELRAPPLAHTLPEGWESMRTTELAAGIAAWAAVQRATTRWKEAQWLAACTELPVGPGADTDPDINVAGASVREHKRSTVRIRADAVHAPGDGGQVVSADIDPAPSPSASALAPAPAPTPPRPATATRTRTRPLSQPSIAETKATLRRLSALVLAGYGGASLWALGAPLVPRTPHGHAAQQAQIAAAVQRSEEEEAGGPPPPSAAAAAVLSGVGGGGAAAQVETGAGTSAARSRYAWHALLRGTHDAEIFAAFAGSTPSAAAPDADEPAARAAGAHLGAHADMPRFWVLADGARREVVLVVRGTMSGAELAADIACAPVPFAPARTPRPSERGDAAGMPGYLPTGPPRVEKRAEGGEGEAGEPYTVHGGMLLLAQAMGGRGKPVHVAVAKALRAHRGYDLVLCGHSLGAGVATLLGLSWADPATCLTVPSSGLSAGRRVRVFALGAPCVTSPALGARAARLVTSVVHGHDVVSALSLGAVRDLGRAAAWLCAARAEGAPAGVLRRVLAHRAGLGRDDDADWCIALRKTLEANMVLADLVPPGRVWWALRDGALHPAHRRAPAGPGGTDTLRLFEVREPRTVFGQLMFAGDMLSSHMPHEYERVLHELL